MNPAPPPRKPGQPRATSAPSPNAGWSGAQPTKSGKPQALELDPIRAEVIAAYRGDSRERPALSMFGQHIAMAVWPRRLADQDSAPMNRRSRAGEDGDAGSNPAVVPSHPRTPLGISPNQRTGSGA